jgi:hypothetical protein
MFCIPVLVFGGTEGVKSRFDILRARARFQRYRRRQVTFLCFARPNSFSAVQTASGPDFMFCAPGNISGGAEGVGSRFSYFALPDSFSAFPRASGPIFMFCVPVLIFDGTEGVRYRFLVLRSRTHFQRYPGRRVPFSCFARPNSFSAVPTASAPVFMYCHPEHFFDGAVRVESHFHVLHSRTHFRRFRDRWFPFSCFASPYSFSTVSRASGPVFTFCAPGLVFGGTVGVNSRFHVLRVRTHFRRYRWHWVPF